VDGNEPSEGVLVFSESREGFEHEAKGKFSSVFAPGEHLHKLEAFDMFRRRTENGEYREYACCKDSFSEPGYYNYEVGIYSREDVESVLGVNYHEANYKDIDENVTPLLRKEGGVAVSEWSSEKLK